MLFAEFTERLEELEGLSSRLKMTEELAGLFSKLTKDEIKPASYLLTGRVAPFFLPVEFNFSTRLLLKAFSELTGKPVTELDDEYKQVGDIGDLAQKLPGGDSQHSLSIAEVFDKLEQIAFTAGSKSQGEKQQAFLWLAKRSSALELKYISRILAGNMRLGLSIKTIFDALSWAVAGDKSLRDLIEYAYGVSVDLGLIAHMLLTEGPGALKKVKATPGIPVASKLVERVKSAEEIIERMGPSYIQPKFDGLRVQIHYSKKGFPGVTPKDSSELSLFSSEGVEPEKVRIFSRNLENLTAMLPEVVAAINSLELEEVILDGEAIGFDENSESFLSFQETIKRKRKHKVAELSESVPLQVNVFDVLAYNGKDLLHEPIDKRIAVMEQIFGKDAYTKPQGVFKLAETTLVSTVEELEELFNNYVGQNLEGIIAKDESTSYDPGTRNFDWIKLKASVKNELVDTIDAVVLGYYFGTGVRARFGIGAILIGAYDPEADRYISLSKVGTGFKDADWSVIKGTLDPIKLETLPENVVINRNLMPDVLVRPEVVVVVEADSISVSKLHGEEDGKGASQGLSLRFPRIKVFGRDKRPQDATTIKELQRMYELQAQEGREKRK